MKRFKLKLLKQWQSLWKEKLELRVSLTYGLHNRAGRITASIIKSVCHTDSTNPSQSLVKLISYPVDFLWVLVSTHINLPLLAFPLAWSLEIQNNELVMRC